MVFIENPVYIYGLVWLEVWAIFSATSRAIDDLRARRKYTNTAGALNLFPILIKVWSAHRCLGYNAGNTVRAKWFGFG